MPNREVCAVCRFKLPLCMRVDTQYCGGTCRVRAFRARREGHSITGRWDQHAGRMPDPAPDSPATRARTQLAIEQALRAERGRRAKLAARLTRAERTVAEQQRALTEERDRSKAAASKAEAEVLNGAAKIVSQRMDLENLRKMAQESSHQLDEQKMLARGLSAECGRLRREAREAHVSLAKVHEMLATERLNAENEAQRHQGEIGRLRQELHEAREANRQLAPGNRWRGPDSREVADDRKSRIKLKREFSEAQEQLAIKQEEYAALARSHHQQLLAFHKCCGERKRLQEELAECRTALEVQKQATVKVAEAMTTARLPGTGVSYIGALSGGYNRHHDRLALSKQSELHERAELARWQYLHGKRQTARDLDPNKTIEDQAMDAAIAARWTLLSEPPKVLRWRPGWEMWGFVLDDQSEEYLLKQSHNMIADLAWERVLRGRRREFP